jgi:hypothetical protein
VPPQAAPAERWFQARVMVREIGNIYVDESNGPFQLRR